MVFPNLKGGDEIEARAATRSVTRARKKFVAAGIAASLNTHDLRRTFATQLGEMGMTSNPRLKGSSHA